MKSERGALVISGVMFAACIALAMHHTFVEPNFFKSAFCISLAFTFYFVVRNPRFLMSTSFQEACERYDDLRDKKYVFGTTPLYPATLLVALVYIAYAKFGWPLS